MSLTANSVSNLYDLVIGQQQAKSRLQQNFRTGRIPHAMMFTGPGGFGALPLAMAFAQHLLCETPAEKGGCGTCGACKKVRELMHPDLHLCFPIAISKKVRSSDHLISEFREAYTGNPYMVLNEWFGAISAENKQPVIPVDEANAIIRKLSYTSFAGKYRIMVIWYPEKMNTECANKLLKILEEPSEQTVFILLSAQPEQLLPTIISRVQQLPLAPCSDGEIADALVTAFNVKPEVARETAVMSNGNYGEAVSILGNTEENVGLLTSFQAFMRLALKFDANKILPWIDEFATEGREKHKQFLQYGLAVFRDALMFNYGSQSLVKLAGQEKLFLEKFAPFIHQGNYAKLIEEFNSNYYYIERNANPKILFMDLAIKTFELLNKKGR